MSQSLLTSAATSSRTAAQALVVVVNDADAVYPVRIDPTFSDANWSSIGGIPGADGDVRAAVVDSAGNLYIGGSFTAAGDVIANNIAKRDGSSWTALGSGMTGGGYIYANLFALAVLGSDLYAGGSFTIAGGKVSGYIPRAYLPTVPTLSILRSDAWLGGIKVSWPSVDTSGFVLQQAGALPVTANWVTNAVGVTDDGTTKSVTLPGRNSAQFFRLRRP